MALVDFWQLNLQLHVSYLLFQALDLVKHLPLRQPFPSVSSQVSLTSGQRNYTVSQQQVDIHSCVILLQSHIGIKGIVSHPDGSPQPNAQIKVSNVTDDEQEPQPIRHGVTSGKQ